MSERTEGTSLNTIRTVYRAERYTLDKKGNAKSVVYREVTGSGGISSKAPATWYATEQQVQALGGNIKNPPFEIVHQVVVSKMRAD